MGAEGGEDEEPEGEGEGREAEGGEEAREGSPARARDGEVRREQRRGVLSQVPQPSAGNITALLSQVAGYGELAPNFRHLPLFYLMF